MEAQGLNDVIDRSHHQLQQFVLTDVTPTGRVLGSGSYGSVVEVLSIIATNLMDLLIPMHVAS